MRLSRIFLPAGLLAALLAACGGSTNNGSSSGGSGGSVAPVPQSEFIARYSSAVCDNIGGCCKTAGYSYDAAACKTGLEAQMNSTVPTDARYDATAAGQCLKSIAQAMSACKGFGVVVANACSPVFIGTKAAGAPCKSNAECAPVAGSDVECNQAAGGGQKICVATPHGKQGDACSATCTKTGNSGTCMSGLGGTGGGTGASGGSGGGVPSSNTICYTNEGLYCASNAVCHPLISIGGSCTSTAMGCVDGAYCDTSVGQCAKKLPAGSACKNVPGACQDKSYCAADGTCTSQQPDGASCTSYRQCQSGQCKGGTCGSNADVTPSMCGGHQTPQPDGGAGPPSP